jgi:hypothetical protein
MDGPQAFEVRVTIELPRAKFHLALAITRVALGLIALIIASLLLHGNAHLAWQALLCSLLADSPRITVASRRIFS